jgi:hypothetical protein
MRRTSGNYGGLVVDGLPLARAGHLRGNANFCLEKPKSRVRYLDENQGRIQALPTWM